jgi:hypothetical protein
MIKVTLEIDNKMAHSCSPLEYLRKYILKDAKLLDRWPWTKQEIDTPMLKLKL